MKARYNFPYKKKRITKDIQRDFRKTYSRHVYLAEKSR